MIVDSIEIEYQSHDYTQKKQRETRIALKKDR